MDAATTTLAPSSKLNRSAISNASWRLEGADNRKAHGRRFRDLCMAFASDLGGEATLTTPQRALIRQTAAVIVESEKLQTTIANGGAVDHEQLVRNAGASTANGGG